jgi:hypothetical protein
VQGFELEVLGGAAGFSEVGRYNVSFGPDGTPIQADFLFHRNTQSNA